MAAPGLTPVLVEELARAFLTPALAGPLMLEMRETRAWSEATAAPRNGLARKNVSCISSLSVDP